MRDQDPSNGRTLLLLDSLSGGILAVDRSATITYLNAARTLALQPEAAVGKTPRLPPRPHRQCSPSPTQGPRQLPLREPPDRVATGYRRGLSQRFLRLPLPRPDGTITGAVLTFQEIGSLISRQQEQARAEELAPVGFIEAGIADEIRNRRSGMRDESTGGAASTEEPSHVRSHRSSYPHPR